MTPEEIRAVIARALAVRVPQFVRDDRPGDKIARLEDTMLGCAHMRAELEEAWIYCMRVIHSLDERLMLLSGVVVGRRLAADREAMIREADPAAWGAMRDAQALRKEIERQIHRLTQDEATVSRAYTFITGN